MSTSSRRVSTDSVVRMNVSVVSPPGQSPCSGTHNAKRKVNTASNSDKRMKTACLEMITAEEIQSMANKGTI